MMPNGAPPPRICCLGDCTVDTVFKVDTIPNMDAKVMATDCVQGGAGMASSAAIAIARLGGRSAIWGRIGDDAGGDLYLADLRAEGVDVSGLRIVEGGRTSTSSIIVDGQGQRLVVAFYDPEFGSDTGWMNLDSVIDFHAVMTDVRWPEESRALLTAARRAGVLSVLDADVATPEVLADLAPLADHVVFSEPGLRLFQGADLTPEEALRRADERLSGKVGVTLGAEGYRWIEDGQLHAARPPKINAIDTLAPGDVFHGAYVLGLAEGRSLADIADFACRAAALKCTRFGGRAGAPTRAELEAF